MAKKRQLVFIVSPKGKLWMSASRVLDGGGNVIFEIEECWTDDEDDATPMVKEEAESLLKSKQFKNCVLVDVDV